MHWNNPEIRKDYTDSSGMTFFLTPNLRTYEAGVLMLGQRYLEIPPHQTSYSTEGRCKGSCTTSIMEGPVYITDSFNHMHYLGKKVTSPAHDKMEPITCLKCMSGLYTRVGNFISRVLALKRKYHEGLSGSVNVYRG